MEVDGGEVERGRSELGSLVEAIKSSEVLEDRISLINRLEGSSQFSADDLGLILESLLVSWDDSTCSGVSHCMLHKSILQVAVKCSYVRTTTCQRPAHGVGNISYGLHTNLFKADHLCAFIISLTLNISIKILPIATKCITVDVVHTIGDLVSELLILTESSIVDKKIHGAAAHVAQAAPVF